jgi:hypothetical protein
MKVAGIVLTVLGVLMLVSSARLAITTYNLNSSHDVSTFFGGLAIAALVTLGGISLIKKSRVTPKEK